MNKDMEVYVPDFIKELASNYTNPKTHMNSKSAYKLRLEAIREYTDEVLKQEAQKGRK